MGRVFEKRKHKMFARFDRMAKAFTRIGKEIAIAVKQEKGTQLGTFLMSSSNPADTIAAAIMPITFCASLPPCPKLKSADETNCNRRNHLSALCGVARLQMFTISTVIKNAMIIPIKGARNMKRKVGITFT